jgi:hypothetical protein
MMLDIKYFVQPTVDDDGKNLPEFEDCIRVLETKTYSTSDAFDTTSVVDHARVRFLDYAEVIISSLPHGSRLRIPWGSNRLKHWINQLSERDIHVKVPINYMNNPMLLADAYSCEQSSYCGLWFQCQLGIDVNVTEPTKDVTALHLLVCSMSKMQNDLFAAKLRLLVQHGANVYALSKFGVTPVSLAFATGNPDQFFDVLEEMGYDVEEVLDRSYEVEEEWDRQNDQRDSIWKLSGGGFSTDLDAADLAPSRDGLTARQPRVFEVES